jgi:hypothetical protein
MVAGHFVDAAPGNGVTFVHQAPHTPRKYLLETMGSGVALFDSNNNGLLDIYLINGAPFGDYVAPGTILEKTGPKYWNRLYRQSADGSGLTTTSGGIVSLAEATSTSLRASLAAV